MRKIEIGKYTFTSTQKPHDFPNFRVIGQFGDRQIFSIVVHPYFNGYGDPRRRVYVDHGCRVRTEIHDDYRVYPLYARINAGEDYFGLLRFLWRFCEIDSDFDDLRKWLDDTIDLALNGIY